MTRRPKSVPEAIGVDTGGTFTDFVAIRDGRLIALNLPSTPSRPDRAVTSGLRRLGAARETRVRHGSTVATNTLLERTGARVALITTAGFEDLIEIGRQDRPDIYALVPVRTPSLVPVAMRFGVDERIGPRGQRWRPLGARETARVAGAVRAARPEAIAIGFLHAYADPAHEQRVERALAGLGVPLTRSTALCPEIREYERIATTVVNAYLAPRMSRYLRGLASGTRARIEIVMSHGGLAPPALAAREPARQLLSGPAAGLKAARDVARASRFRRALTLDVGGTSTDCAFIDGDLPRRRAREVAGVPIQLPMLDVDTIGAGGGSIARVDPGGLLVVGPESAAADPGPACYGRGGPATVTDALVLLGRIPDRALAGGTLALDRRAAARALARLGRDLGGRSAEDAAAGVITVIEAHMAGALRRVSVARGHDPRGAALVAFGGAGGLHACALAGMLECAAVLFPRHAGVLSAIGALTAGPRREKSRSVLLGARDTAAIARVLAGLEAAVRAEFERTERARVVLERWAEVRYRGQSHEIPLTVDARLAERFHREHRRRFGFDDRAAAVEVVTLEARGALPDAPMPRDAGSAATGERRDRRPAGATVRVRHGDRSVAARRIDRTALAPGDAIAGPAVVVEAGATLWIPPRWRGRSNPPAR